MWIVSGHFLQKRETISEVFVRRLYDYSLKEVIWSETSGIQENDQQYSCTKIPWSKGDNSCYKIQAFAKLVIFTVQEYEDKNTHKYTQECTHTHTHTLACSLYLSLFLIKALSGLFSILMWFMILCQHLTSQAVGIRFIQREANRLWLATAEDCR